MDTVEIFFIILGSSSIIQALIINSLIRDKKILTKWSKLYEKELTEINGKLIHIEKEEKIKPIPPKSKKIYKN